MQAIKCEILVALITAVVLFIFICRLERNYWPSKRWHLNYRLFSFMSRIIKYNNLYQIVLIILSIHYFIYSLLFIIVCRLMYIFSFILYIILLIHLFMSILLSYSLLTGLVHIQVLILNMYQYIGITLPNGRPTLAVGPPRTGVISYSNCSDYFMCFILLYLISILLLMLNKYIISINLTYIFIYQLYIINNLLYFISNNLLSFFISYLGSLDYILVYYIMLSSILFFIVLVIMVIDKVNIIDRLIFIIGYIIYNRLFVVIYKYIDIFANTVVVLVIFFLLLSVYFDIVPLFFLFLFPHFVRSSRSLGPRPWPFKGHFSPYAFSLWLS